MPFEPGNKLAAGGVRPHAGRKPNVVRKRLQTLLAKSAKNDDLTTILDVAVAAAKSGQPWAVEFLFDRIFGKVGTETDRAIAELIEQHTAEREAAIVVGTGDTADDENG